jgi:uncharacterized repeat protein (TIGR01451 family)
MQMALDSNERNRMKIRWLVCLTIALLAGARSGSAQLADLSLTASAQAYIYGTEHEPVYTLTVSNAGPAMATGVVVSSQIPANYNVTFVSAGQVVIYNGFLTISLGSVPAGQSITFNLTELSANQSSGGTGGNVNPIDLERAQLTNTFIVSANETDPNATDNSAATVTELDSIFPGAPNTWTSYDASYDPLSGYDLKPLHTSSSYRIDLSFGPSPDDAVNPFEALGLIVVVSNYEGVHLNNGSPGDVVFLGGTNAGPGANTDITNWLAVVRFSNPDDPTGALGHPATQDQAFFPFSAVNADGFTSFSLFPNVIYVTGTETSTNGFITVTASYGEANYGYFGELDYYYLYLSASHAPLGLRLSASAAPEPVVVGNNLVYSLTVSNAMTRLATGVVVSNRIPAGVSFVSASGGTVSTNNGVLLVQLGQLSPGASSAVQVVMQTTVVNSLVSVFGAYCNQPDPDPNNGYATVISTVNGVATPNSADVGFTMTTMPYQDAEVTLSPYNSLTNPAVLTYALTVTNAGPAPATGVVVSNQLLANVNFVSATGGTVTTNNGTLLVSLGALAVGATDQVQIVLKPTVQFLVPAYSVGVGTPAATLTNVIQVSANEYDPVAGNNTATAIAGILAAVPGIPLDWTDPGGALIVTDAGDGFGVQPVQFNLDTNDTAIPGDVVMLIDPSGGISPTNWEAVINFFNPVDPTGAQGLPATESQTFFGGNVPNGFANFALFPNTVYLTNASIVAGSSALATTSQFGPIGGIPPGQFDINIYTAIVQPTNSELSLSASALPSPATLGSNLVYALTITNAGLWPATDVVISNQLPANVNFVSATGGATPASGVLLLNLGTLAVGATGSAQITVQPTATGTLTNSFQVSADQTNFVPANAMATVVTTVTTVSAAADLSLSASAAPQPVTVGSNLVYSLMVSNAGPATATGVVIGNQLPANVHFDFATGITAVTSTNGVLLLNLAPLAAGTNQLVQITVLPNAAGSITNQFQVSASQADPIPADNSATVVSTVANVGGPLLLTISYSNNAAIVSWTPTVTGWTLQTNNHLATGDWGNYAGPVINNQATNSPPTGNVFFRLMHP